MTGGSHDGSWQLTRLPLQEFNSQVWQVTAAVVIAVALGLAIAADAYAAVALFGSAAAALALGVSFTFRRFGTLIAVWLFFMLQPLLVAVAGGGSAAGRLIDVVDIPILLIIGLLGFFLAARDHAIVVRWLLIAAGVVLACGFASDLTAGASLSVGAIGAIFRLKLFLLLGAGLAVTWTPSLARKTLKVVVLAALVAAVAGILDFASGGAMRDLFPTPAKPLRLGHVAAGGLFSNVAVLSTFMAIAFTILLGMTWQGTAPRRIPQLFLVGLAALSTLRLKAVATILAAAAALAVTSRRARSRLVLVAVLGALTLSASTMITGSNLATGIFDEQVGRYTSGTPQPRERLQAVSIDIALDNFPLGVGFGRFGSPPSVERGSYSPIYSQYGLTKYYGFSPKDLPIHFALDTSWPGLLGEVGALGFLAFAATILALTASLFRRAREGNARSNFASIGFGVMIVIIVDSLGRPTLFDTFTLLTVVLIVAPGLWLAPDRERVT